MSIDTSISPYYDDFNEDKNYHKILFDPDYCVQARELTQIQTILQNQIDKVGKFLFKEGSIVSGCEVSVDDNVKLVYLNNDFNTKYNIENFLNLFVVGQTNKIVGQIISVDPTNLYLIVKILNNKNVNNFLSDENLYIFGNKEIAFDSILVEIVPLYYTKVLTEFSYTFANCTGNKYSQNISINSVGISIGDILEHNYLPKNTSVIEIIDANNVKINNQILEDFSNQTITKISPVCRNVIQVSINDGIVYSNKYFVKFSKNFIIPDINTKYFSSVVGFEVVETIVTYEDDSTLLDPALGSANYTAPGADRYKISFNLVSKPLLDNTPTNLTDTKFIEIIRFNEGTVQNIVNKTVLGDVQKILAKRTYEQSGDFIINPYNIIFEENDIDDPKYIAKITPGKSYIQGYEVENISPVSIEIDKCREFSNISNYALSTYYGNFIEVANVQGSIINFNTGGKINLHNVSTQTANSNNVIGSATIRTVNGIPSSNNFQIFLYDINLINNDFKNVKSIRAISENFSANVFANTVVSDSNYEGLIFEYPQKNIFNISDTTFSAKKVFKNKQFINGIATISTDSSNEQFLGGTGIIPLSEAKQYYLIIKNDGTYVPVEQCTITVQSTIPGNPSVVTINTNDNYNGFGDIIGTFSSSNNKKIKILIENQSKSINVSSSSVYYDLGKSDILNLNGAFEIGNTYSFSGTWNNSISYSNNSSVEYNGNVYLSTTNSNLNYNPETSVNWTVVDNKVNSYILDNGQRDSYYDHGYIKLNENRNPSNTVFVFDYFSHSGGYGYFCSDSYTNIDYSEIPKFISQKTGAIYNLRDCVDFRPRKSDDIDPNNCSFDYNLIPIPFNIFYSDYSYYLSRIDKVVLTYDKNFKVIKGISSYINNVPPNDISNALTLFTLNIGAFTYSINDINVTYNEHKRYTMEDIGKLENRIYNVEYYTALNFLEKNVISSDIIDSNTNLALFKSGFLVDAFTGHGTGDVLNPDYNCAIDFTNQYLRPKFNSQICQFDIDQTSQNFALNKNILSFPYIEKSLISQIIATDYTTNLNPFNVISYVGILKLTPSSDIWYDNINRPIVNVVNEDNDAWTKAKNYIGTQWNDWEIIWSGQNSANDPSTTKQILSRTGVQTTIKPTNIVNSDTSQVISSEIIPYARSIDIQFEAFNLPPYTEMFVYANDILISGYVTPTINPLGQISNINVIDQGSAYVKPIINIIGSNTSIANVSCNTISGAIDAAFINYPGLGYDEDVTATVVDSGGGFGSGASLEITTLPFMGSPLITDKNGYCSGIISLPNNDNIKIPTGKIKFTICNHIYSTALSGAFAEADFMSRGLLNTVQETIISTRTPVLVRTNISESKTSYIKSNQYNVNGNSASPSISPTLIGITFNGNGTNGGQSASFSTPKNNKFKITLFGAGYNRNGNDNNSWKYSFSVPGKKIKRIILGKASVATVGDLTLSIININKDSGKFTIQMNGYFGASYHEGYGYLTVEVE